MDSRRQTASYTRRGLASSHAENAELQVRLLRPITSRGVRGERGVLGAMPLRLCGSVGDTLCGLGGLGARFRAPGGWGGRAIRAPARGGDGAAGGRKRYLTRSSRRTQSFGCDGFVYYRKNRIVVLLLGTQRMKEETGWTPGRKRISSNWPWTPPSAVPE